MPLHVFHTQELGSAYGLTTDPKGFNLPRRYGKWREIPSAVLSVYDAPVLSGAGKDIRLGLLEHGFHVIKDGISQPYSEDV